MWILLFGAPLAVLATLGDNSGGTTFGGTPVSLLTMIVLFGVIVRRALVLPAVMHDLPPGNWKHYAGIAVADG